MKRLLFDPLRTLVTLALMLPATALTATTVTVISWFNKTSPAIEWCIQRWSRTWFVLSHTELEVRGTVDTTRSYVVVSNHSSWLDIMANFIATPVPLRFLAKKELFKIPILSTGMRAIGIIEIDRDNATSMHQLINERAAEVAHRAQSVMVYPEGTRTRTGEVRRFKVGAFVIAITNQMPILPVTISGSFDAFPPGVMVRGGKIIVDVGEPVETTGLAQGHARQLTREVQELITATRARLDAER